MLSLPDMAILGIAALLIFGEERLPGIMRQAGRVIRDVQNTSASFVREMERAADLHEAGPVNPYDEPAPQPGPDEEAPRHPDAPSEE